MLGFKFRSYGGCVFGLPIYCFVLVSDAQVTDSSEVSALLAVRVSLMDPMNHLNNWKKGDPCTSNWTGVICADQIGVDGFWHVQEIQLLNRNLSGSLASAVGQFSHLKILLHGVCNENPLAPLIRRLGLLHPTWDICSWPDCDEMENVLSGGHGLMVAGYYPPRDLVEERWDDLIGDMQLNIAFPALEGHRMQIVMGRDPKNGCWNYNVGGPWPVLLWPKYYG